jgi:ABC-type branched-subunit amino acid transport system substrate-binding protein
MLSVFYDNPVASIKELVVAADAAKDRLNANGGINGRPLQIDVCNNMADPNTSAACARQAVSNHDVATVASAYLYPTPFPILDKAGIPSIGGYGLQLADYTDKLSFPLHAGVFGYTYESAAQIAATGAKHIATIVCDLAVCKDNNTSFVAALKAKGLSVEKSVAAPSGAPDYSSQVGQIIGGNIDAVKLIGGGGDQEKEIKTLRQLGYKGNIFIADQIYQGLLDSMGGNLNNIYVAGEIDLPTDPKTTNPEIKAFQAAMKKSDSSQPIDPGALTAWTAVTLFSKVAATIKGPITSSSVLSAFENLKTPVALGTTCDYSVVGKTPPAAFPRMFNTCTIAEKVVNGQTVQYGQSANPFQ